MTTEEKLAEIEDTNWCAHEKPIVLKYVEALKSGDLEKIAKFEYFGNTPRQIVMNGYHHKTALHKFGYDKFEIGDYGWMKRPVFTDEEEIEFKYDDYGGNSITTAKGKNGKFARGISFSCGMCGGGNGISVFNEAFNTREEAIKDALLNLKDIHTKGLITMVEQHDTTNYKEDKMKSILKQIEVYLSPKQLELF